MTAKSSFLTKLLAVPLVSLGLSMIPFTAMAATNISSVSLTIDSGIEVGDDNTDVDITSNSSLYSVDSYKVTNKPSDAWEEGDNPKLKITLELENSSRYNWNVTKSKVSISGDDGTVTSVSKSGSHLYIYYTMDDLEDDDTSSSDYDLQVSDLEWDEDAGTAYWNSDGEAKKYELKLYRGDKLVKSVTTSNEYYNFASYFTTSGDYQFKVRGVYNSSNKGSWESSDSFYVTSSEASEIRSSSSSSTSSYSSTGPSASTSNTAQWIKDSVGWWYRNANGTYTTNGWQYINGYWYYFNNSGYMATGWQYINGYWYYLDPTNGNMWFSTITPDGYTLNADGVWVH